MNRIALQGVVLAVLAGLPVAARAQTALGTGRGLEKNLQKGGSGQGNAPRRDFGAEVRLRNAVVTGNAPGGRSLRITPPYSDPGDFRDPLGSSDLFAFRRDSLYSGLAGQGYRGTEGLQYQFGWSTGGTIPVVVNRDGIGAGSVATGATSGAGDLRYSTKSWEIAQPLTGSMRSTASFVGTRSLTPVTVGTRASEKGREILAASSLLGLRGVRAEEPEAWNKPLGQPSAPAPTPTKPASDLSAKPAGTRPETTTGQRPAELSASRTAYDDLRVRLEKEAEELDKSAASSKTPEPKPGETKPGTVKPGEAKPGEIKPGTIPGVTPPAPDTTGLKGGSASAISDAKLGLGETSAWEKRMQAIRDAIQESSARNADAAKPSLDRDTLKAIRKAGQEKRAASLIPQLSEGTDTFGSHLKAGEKLMKEERYFDAEERFTQAIRMKAGDATALAGRINAQLGSGLIVSAAVNLRELARTRPDVIGMLFSDQIMPTAARQEQIVALLRRNMSADGQEQKRIPRESALLMAYMGYQKSDQAMVREGLSEYRKFSTDSDRAFLELIEGVWLGEDTKK